MPWSAVGLMWLALPFQPAAPPVHLHATTVSSLQTWNVRRARDVEFWIGPDREYVRTGQNITISRFDLGVRWMLDTERRTYRERPIPAEEQQARAALLRGAPAARATKAATEDIHTVGTGTAQILEWTVREPGTASGSAGRVEARTADGESPQVQAGLPCDRIVVDGDADYMTATLALLVGRSPAPLMAHLFNRAVLSELSTTQPDIPNQVRERLATRQHPLLLSVDASSEEPYSGTVKSTMAVKSFERAVPPAGLYEVPSGYQKASQ